MNEFPLDIAVERLINAFGNIMFLTPDELIVTPSRNRLKELQDCLNSIFPDNRCLDILYTLNTDKLYFGIKVSPSIGKETLLDIISGEERMKLGDYKVELDSRLFMLGMDATELAAYLIYEISTTVDSYETIDNLRLAIDLHMTSEQDTLQLRESAQYAQLVIFAIKDTIDKMTSLMYKDQPEEYVNNSLIQTVHLDEALVSAHDTIITSEYGPKDSMRASNITILQWMFIMYKDMALNSSTVMEDLRDYKTTTGSRLEIEEINATIDAVNRIDATIPMRECSLVEFLESCNVPIREGSLFAGLRKNGLRNVEDSLYEYSLRIKNLETEEDAMYVMRGINTRIALLQDYLYNSSDLSPKEVAHYEAVIEKYMKLREELVRKKIWNKKQYGLWFDYDQFDEMCREESEIMKLLMKESETVVCPSCNSDQIVFGDNNMCTCNECGNTFACK